MLIIIHAVQYCLTNILLSKRRNYKFKDQYSYIQFSLIDMSIIMPECQNVGHLHNIIVTVIFNNVSCY